MLVYLLIYHQSIQISFFYSFHPSIHPSIHSSVHHLPIFFPSIYYLLSVDLSIFFLPSIHPLSIYPSIYSLSISLNVSVSIYHPHLIFVLCQALYSVSLVAQMVKNPPAMQETQVRSLGWEDPLEKEMVTQSSILSWRIPWTEEPGRLQCIGSQRVGHH